MAFNYKCPLCSAENSAEPRMIMDEVECSSCKKKITVPNPNTIEEHSDTSTIPIKKPLPIEEPKPEPTSEPENKDKPKELKFPCPKCAKELSAMPKMIGDSITCYGCQHQFDVPNPNKIAEMQAEAEKTKKNIPKVDEKLPEKADDTADKKEPQVPVKNEPSHPSNNLANFKDNILNIGDKESPATDNKPKNQTEIQKMINQAVAEKKRKLKIFSIVLAIVLNIIVYIVWKVFFS